MLLLTSRRSRCCCGAYGLQNLGWMQIQRVTGVLISHRAPFDVVCPSAAMLGTWIEEWSQPAGEFIERVVRQGQSWSEGVPHVDPARPDSK
jgi:hypothetical protein